MQTTLDQFRDILPDGDFIVNRCTKVWNARNVVINNEQPQYARLPFTPQCMGIPMPAAGLYTSTYLQGITSSFLVDGHVVGVSSTIITMSSSQAAPNNKAYLYLNQYGFNVGDLVVGGVRTPTGEQYYINTFSGVDFYFIPTGFTLSVSDPLVFKDSGTYLLTKYTAPGASTAANAGSAITKWDGCYYYGTIHSPDMYNTTNYGYIAHAIYAKRLYNSLTESGISSVFGNTLCDGMLSQTTGQATKVPIFFTAPQLIMNTNAFNYACTFDGYRIQPLNTLINVPSPLTVNSI